MWVTPLCCWDSCQGDRLINTYIFLSIYLLHELPRYLLSLGASPVSRKLPVTAHSCSATLTCWGYILSNRLTKAGTWYIPPKGRFPEQWINVTAVNNLYKITRRFTLPVYLEFLYHDVAPRLQNVFFFNAWMSFKEGFIGAAKHRWIFWMVPSMEFHSTFALTILNHLLPSLLVKCWQQPRKQRSSPAVTLDV